MNKNNDLILMLAVGIIAYLLISKLGTGLQNIFGSIGIGNTTADEERIDEIEKKEKKGNYFLPSYFQKAPKNRRAMLFTRATADKLAKQIFDSVGIVYDTPNQALAAFKQCKYKTQVSFLAFVFQQNHKRDLQTWLSDKFDTDAQQSVYLKILEYTSQLPEGFVK